MSLLPPFDYVTPVTLDDALAGIGESRLPYAGGTELVLAMRLGLARPEALVDLKGLDSLKTMTEAKSGLEIGAAATHQQLIEFLDARSAYWPLREMLLGVGNPRVRSVGTIGGNLCFAEPRSDIATLLVALDAEVELVSAARGPRRIRLTTFTQGAYVTDRRADEILTRVLIPPMGGARYTYLKFQTGIRPTAGVALVERSDLTVRAVVGAACESPAVHDFESLDQMKPHAVAAAIETTPDLLGSDRYKRNIVSVLLQRAASGLGEAHG